MRESAISFFSNLTGAQEAVMTVVTSHYTKWVLSRHWKEVAMTATMQLRKRLGRIDGRWVEEIK